MIILKNGKHLDEEAVLDAFNGNEFEVYNFLDLNTSKVEFVLDRDISGLDEDKDRLEELDSEPERFVSIPELKSYEKCAWMEDFSRNYVLEEEKNELLYEKLCIALDGKGAFHRFKDVIYNAGDEWVKAWYSYEHDQKQKVLFEWLDDESIEYTIK